MAFKWSPWIQPPDVWSNWNGPAASGCVEQVSNAVGRPPPAGSLWTFNQLVNAPLLNPPGIVESDSGGASIGVGAGYVITQGALRFALSSADYLYGPYLGVPDEEQDVLGHNWWDIQYENDNVGTALGPVEVSFRFFDGGSEIRGFELGGGANNPPRSSTRARNAGPFEVRIGDVLPSTNNGPQNGFPGTMDWSSAAELAAMPKVMDVDAGFVRSGWPRLPGSFVPSFEGPSGAVATQSGEVTFLLTPTADQLPLTYVLCHSRNITGVPPAWGQPNNDPGGTIALDWQGEFRVFYRPPRFRVLIDQKSLSGHKRAQSAHFHSYGPRGYA